MKRNSWTCLVLALAAAAPGLAQERPAEKPSEKAEPAPRRPVTPLKVQLVLSRFKGETKVGSLPYTLPCNADDRLTSHLRMGIEVPILNQYKNVGTNIDCRAASLEDGRFRLEMTIEHSAIYSPPEEQARTATGSAPLFRTFRTGFVPILRDGQSLQYTTATDPVSGEVVKIDVSLTALK